MTHPQFGNLELLNGVILDLQAQVLLLGADAPFPPSSLLFPLYSSD